MVETSVAAGGASVLESYGVPSPRRGERVALVPEGDAVEGVSALETYGTPSAARGERVSFEPSAADDSASVLETYGQPSRSPAERVSFAPSAAAATAGSVLESVGAPSVSSSERLDVIQKPDLSAGDVLEAYGQPSPKRTERVPVLPEPSVEALEQADVLRSLGEPVANRSERVDVFPKPDLVAGNVLETYGQPSSVRSERVALDPEPEVDPSSSTLGTFGQPSADRGDRVDLDPEPEVDLSSSTLGAFGQPSTQRSQRIDLDPEPDIDVSSSSMSGAASLSRDRNDRLGRNREDDEGERAAAGALSLSKDRSERMGYVDPDEIGASSLGGVGSRSVLEAGRMSLREDPDRAVTPEVPTGLEGLMPDPRLRGHDRMRMAEDLEDDEIPPELVGKVPLPPRKVEVVGTLAPDELIGNCGDPRVFKREVVHRRIDFMYQRYETVVIRRGEYHCPLCPDEPVYRARRPQFLAGKTPIGNGMLAQLVASIYDDHATMFDQASLVDRLGFIIEEERIAAALDHAHHHVAPILAAMRAEISAGEGRPVIDKEPVVSRRPDRRRTVDGQLLFVSGATAQVLVHLDANEEDAIVKSVPPSRRKGTAIQELFRERIGFNRAGLWAGVRRRFTTALSVSPREASYGLFLLHAIYSAASPTRGQPEELLRRSRALRAWLEDQREQFEDPDTALQRAVVFALTSWENMRLVDDEREGQPIPEPPSRKFPKTFVPVWTFGGNEELSRALTWYSLTHTCRMLGVRPWEYLFALFTRLSEGPIADPEAWTPHAWAESTED